MDTTEFVCQTRRWISSIVIGLNLCPFAQRVFKENKIRYVVTDTKVEPELLQVLGRELEALVSTPIDSVETTLLIHPFVLESFLDYVDFLEVAEKMLDGLRLRGIIQIASFHPQYQFAESDPESVENFTNRSPYQMLHLLREDSISRIDCDPNKLLEIPERNKKTLRGMGPEMIEAIFHAVQDRAIPPE
jgi:hypothetical protein